MPHPRTFNGPRSLCTCGHTGDGPLSEHASSSLELLPETAGHGPCTMPGCGCRRFVWEAPTQAFADYCDHKRRNI